MIFWKKKDKTKIHFSLDLHYSTVDMQIILFIIMF